MKKILSILLIMTLVLTAFVGCSTPSEPKDEEQPKEETPVEEPKDEEQDTDVSEEGIVKLGLGQIISIGKSTDLDGEKGALGQVDTIMAAVGFDKDGKVASVTIDNAQTKIKFDKDLKLTTDKNDEFKTKVELGADYGMIKASSIGKEWFEQIAALEDWMVGKTIEEIKGMKTVEKDEAHPAVPDEAELTSSVTISVEGYIAAVEEAWEKAVDLDGSAVKVGLGHEISIAKSTGLDGETLPLAQVDNPMAATALDADGKVVGTIIDNAQTKVQFDKDGKVTTDKAGEFKTKVELGADYGMIKASTIGKEWFEQAAALGDWMVGKTAEEIQAMKTYEKDENHPTVPDEAELKSSVTMDAGDYIAVVVEGSEKAK